MSKERKDIVAFSAAIGMLFFSVVLTCAGFIMPPPGQIHDSVLYVLGQCLLFAGGILGVSTYTSGRMRDIRDSVKRDIDSRFRAYEQGKREDIIDEEEGNEDA